MRNKITSKWLSRIFNFTDTTKTIILIILDSIIICISFLLALSTQSENLEFLTQSTTYLLCFLFVLLTVLQFFDLGFYGRFNRQASIHSITTINRVCIISGITMVTLTWLTPIDLPRFTAMVQVAFAIVGITSLRYVVQILGQELIKNMGKKVAIFGAGSAGRQLIAALRWDEEYIVCQLIDDNQKLHGRRIEGIKVTSFEAGRRTMKKLGINTLFLATPSSPTNANQRILNLLKEDAIEVKSVPNLTDLITGKAEINQLRDFDIEDLLERPPVDAASKKREKTVKGKTVLVTGAGGSIGSELCLQILKLKPKRLIVIDISEFNTYQLMQNLPTSDGETSIIPIIGSLQNRNLLSNTFKKFDVDTVYHAAAYKHVPLMEQNIRECIYNNVIGTVNLANIATQNDVQNFILVSTDKAVNPTNVMGASKRLAEMICLGKPQNENQTRFTVVRFGNVLGSSGSVVPLIKKQILNNGPVTVTHPDIVRYFMTIHEASQLIIQAGSMSKGGDILVLDMGSPVNILDLAKKMIRLSGKSVNTACGQTHSDAPIDQNSIKIEFTGLRPGEKMFEEISYGLKLKKTSHPRVMLAQEDRVDPKQVKSLLDAVELAVNCDDFEPLIQLLSKICPDVDVHIN